MIHMNGLASFALFAIELGCINPYRADSPRSIKFSKSVHRKFNISSYVRTILGTLTSQSHCIATSTFRAARSRYSARLSIVFFNASYHSLTRLSYVSGVDSSPYDTNVPESTL